MAVANAYALKEVAWAIATRPDAEPNEYQYAVRLDDLAERNVRAGKRINDELLAEAREKLTRAEPAPRNRNDSPKHR